MQAAIEFEPGEALAAEGAVGATGIGDLLIGEFVADPISDSAGSDADKTVALGAGIDARAADAIETLVEGVEEFGDVAGIVLEIGIHGHDELPAGGAKAGIAGGRFTAVGFESDSPHARIALDERGDLLPALIGAAIVDEDNLGGDIRGIDDANDGIVEERDILRFVENGDADAEGGVIVHPVTADAASRRLR